MTGEPIVALPVEMQGELNVTGRACVYALAPFNTITLTLALPPAGSVEGVIVIALKVRSGKLTV
jgi:hypothetical protein